MSKSNANCHKAGNFTKLQAAIISGENRFQERIVFNVEQRLEIEDTVELLREQVETLKQELQYERQIVEEYHQELLCTNSEMSIITSELQNVFRLEKRKIDEAKGLAQRILSSHKSASESLAELLSAIYDTLVIADELETTV